MVKFIIEHLEPRLWKWCLVEYAHISEFVGKRDIIFTNIKKKHEQTKLLKLGKVYAKSVKELEFKNMCILDPSAKLTLKPTDKFRYILLGGILGDFPPRKRTKEQLTSKMDFPVRNLGKNQMSTNTAAYVAWKILQGTPLEKIRFKRKLVVKVSEFEEIELPFKFVVENNQIVIPKGYISLIKEKS